MLKITQPLAQKWPWKAINFWSFEKQVKFLNNRFKIKHTDTSLTINNALENLENGILFLPKNLTQVIMALPLIKYLDNRSSRTQISIFCYSGQKSLVHGFFPKIPIFEIKQKSFFLESPHFKEMCSVVNNIKPDFSILLERSPSLLTLFLQAGSSPKIRIGLEEISIFPFFNLLIKSSNTSNLPHTYMKIADLWKSKLIHSYKELIKIGPDPTYSAGLRKVLKKADLEDKKIILFIWDEKKYPRSYQLMILKIILLITAEEKYKSWRLVMASNGEITDDLMIDNIPINVPYLKNLSFSKMISLYPEVNLITGLSTPMLYLSVYMHPAVRCFYKNLPDIHDLSAIYDNFKAILVNENPQKLTACITNMLSESIVGN